jgi:uncharacterized membrane protein YhaH (DUF805 family)
MVWAWSTSPFEVGKTSDTDFWYLIQSTIVQLVNLAIMGISVWKDSVGFSKETLVCVWALIGVAGLFTVVSLIVYPFCATDWSSLLAFSGNAAQAFVVLLLLGKRTPERLPVGSKNK